jgi:hypothetical protein
MTPDAAGIEAALAAGLAVHWPALLDGGCRCGWRWDHVELGARLGPRLIEAYNAHVAAALLPVVTQAQAEALRSAADGLDRIASTQGVFFKGFVLEWLRARAAARVTTEPQ